MWSLQPIIFMSVSHDVGDGFLLIKALLVNSSLRKVGLDDMKLAQMPSTLALITDTHIGVMMAEVGLSEFAGSSIESVLIMDAIKVVMS